MALAGNRLVTMSSSTAAAPAGDSNSATVELGVSSSESDEFSVGLYLEASLKMCGPDASGWNPNICVGMEAGISGGYAYSHEGGSELIFAGTVAGIPEDRYAEEAYNVGLFAYETTVTNADTGETQNLIIVNYFLE